MKRSWVLIIVGALVGAALVAVLFAGSDDARPALTPGDTVVLDEPTSSLTDSPTTSSIEADATTTSVTVRGFAQLPGTTGGSATTLPATVAPTSTTTPMIGAPCTSPAATAPSPSGPVVCDGDTGTWQPAG